MSKEITMQTIDRAMQILKSFSANESELSLADLHRKLGVSKSSLQRILNTLILQGVIDKDEKKKTYKLGLELYFLGQLVEKNSHLLSTSKPFMEKLRDEFGESVTLNIISQKKRKCICFIGGGHELTTISYVGQTSPLYAGASAKLLMTHLPAEELSELLNELEFKQIAEHTIMNKEELTKELTKIRQEGYAVSWGERIKGAFSVSAPIRNRLNEVIASVSIIIPTARVDDQKLNQYSEYVKKTALLISNKFN